MPENHRVRGATGERQVLQPGRGVPVFVFHGGQSWLEPESLLILSGDGYEASVQVGNAENFGTHIIARFPTPSNLEGGYSLRARMPDGELHTLYENVPFLHTPPAPLPESERLRP